MYIFSVSSITYNIYYKIFSKFLSEFDWYFCDFFHHFWIISIYMDYRGHNSFSNFRTKKTRIFILRNSRKSYLIIHDDMYISSRSVIFQILKFIGFINHSKLFQFYPYPAWAASPWIKIPIFFLRVKS